MTLNAAEPSAARMVSELPSYIRENRTEINSVTVDSGFSINNLTITVGTTSLTVGTELVATGHELIILTGTGASELATILAGTDGQIKTFIFQNGNVDMLDGTKAGGKFYLNHLPALTVFAAATDDVLSLINIGGNGGTVDGYWKELYRTVVVK